MWHVWGRRQVHTQWVFCRNVKEDDNLEEVGVEGRIIFNVKEIGWDGVD
jgi:hypothetical protein